MTVSDKSDNAGRHEVGEVDALDDTLSDAPDDDADDDQDFPMLDQVVVPGDETVIKTAKLARELERQIEELEGGRTALSPAEISRAITGNHVEKLINELIEHHMEALRRDLIRVVSRLARDR
jgi:hypothetical protein